MDERVYRVAVERGVSGLAYLGFELNSRAKLDELTGRLVDDASWTAGRYERASVWGQTPG
jgi:hypothetical protein